MSLLTRRKPEPAPPAETGQAPPSTRSERTLLARLGEQIEAGLLTERDMALWAWIHGRYGATGFRFNWAANGPNLGFGGVGPLAESLGVLQRLGWITCSEDVDTGDVRVRMSR